MNCVYRASSVEQADIVAAWLEEQGISAFVKNRHMAGNYVSLAVAPKGVEVCVLDDKQAEQARELLTEHDRGLQARQKATHQKVVPMLCTECGRQVEFPGELFGTVQSCPSCGRHIDVGEEPRFA